MIGSSIKIGLFSITADFETEFATLLNCNRSSHPHSEVTSTQPILISVTSHSTVGIHTNVQLKALKTVLPKSNVHIFSRVQANFQLM